MFLCKQFEGKIPTNKEHISKTSTLKSQSDQSQFLSMQYLKVHLIEQVQSKVEIQKTPKEETTYESIQGLTYKKIQEKSSQDNEIKAEKKK